MRTLAYARSLAPRAAAASAAGGGAPTRAGGGSGVGRVEVQNSEHADRAQRRLPVQGAIASTQPRALAVSAMGCETGALEPAQPQAPLLAWLSVHEGPTATTANTYLLTVIYSCTPLWYGRGGWYQYRNIDSKGQVRRV